MKHRKSVKKNAVGKRRPARKAASSAKDRALAEAQGQQRATSDILRVIATSRADLQPVFDTIVQSALRLCRTGRTSHVIRLVDGQQHLVANLAVSDEWREQARRAYPQPVRADTVSGTAILERRTVHVPDLEADERFPQARRFARAMGLRSLVFVPILRDSEPLGAIGVAGMDPFSPSQIAVLETFADQAAIAIENARLLSELQNRNVALTESNARVTEALDQQTATSEILRVISSSLTDTQPVFDTIVRSAVRLCRGTSCGVLTCEADMIHVRAQVGENPETRDAVLRRFPIPVTRDTVLGRVILDGQVLHVPDFEAPGAAPEGATAIARMIGYRSALFTPMFRDGRGIGVILVGRREPGPFSEEEIRLLGTFADQAVIAIENVRLFTELQTSNRDLTTALDTQTATADILRVISGSRTDVQPVFDAIVLNAVRLCDGLFSALWQYDGELVHQVAQHNYTPEAREAAQRVFPTPPAGVGMLGRAIVERAVIHVPDAEADRKSTRLNSSH